jgi:TonB family protein
MPLTQIPLQPPPTDRRPEQGDLFDAVTWESAYREMHDFPTLLIQARDDLARSRKREAFWMSVVVHILLILTILNADRLARYLPHRAVMLVKTGDKRDLTFLELPSDLQKAVKPPKTNVMSDKTRVAESRNPKLDQQQLKKILDAMRRGRRGPSAPPQPQQPAPAPPQQSAQAAPQQERPQSPPTPAPPMTAKLQSPPVQQKSPFEQQPMSAERTIAQAAEQVASNRGKYGPGDEGDLGLGQRQSNARVGPYEILSDTMGVDFGPYLQRVLHDVKQNWYAIIPESALPPLLKRGKVSVEFSILKNGQAVAMAYVTGSGDVALDRAAYGGITASNPFPPLPREYAGQALRLRFTFYYNPDPREADLQ